MSLIPSCLLFVFCITSVVVLRFICGYNAFVVVLWFFSIVFCGVFVSLCSSFISLCCQVACLCCHLVSCLFFLMPFWLRCVSL